MSQSAGPTKVTKKQAAWGTAATSESTWPATAAIVVTIVIHLLLPAQFAFGPQWLLPLLLAAIIIPVSILSPQRTPNESKYRQWLAVLVTALVSAMNAINLVMLVRGIIYDPKSMSGSELIVGSIGVWITNVIVFGLWYWEIDRGGPDERLKPDHAPPDLLFPQMSTPAAAPPGWGPCFIDYLYVSFTNATAFSPTDTMPLTHVMKMLFLAQSLISLLTVTFVAARAVNILS